MVLVVNYVLNGIVQDMVWYGIIMCGIMSSLLRVSCNVPCDSQLVMRICQSEVQLENFTLCSIEFVRGRAYHL